MKTGLFLALAVFALVVTARWSEAVKIQREQQLLCRNNDNDPQTICWVESKQ